MTLKRAAVVISALLLTGCGQATAGPGPGSPLWNRTFVSKALTGSNAPQLVAGTTIRLTFEQGQVQANAGCNALFGDLRIGTERLAVSGLGSTDMGCSAERLAQDAWLSSFLAAGPSWDLAGDDLTLRTPQGELTLTDQRATSAAAARPLAGPRWTVESIVEGPTTSSAPAGVRAYLVIGDAGTVTGSDGCNRFSGKARRDAARITFSGVASPKRPCAGAGRALQSVLATLLGGSATVQITGDRLTMTMPDGRAIVLRAG